MQRIRTLGSECICSTDVAACFHAFSWYWSYSLIHGRLFWGRLTSYPIKLNYMTVVLDLFSTVPNFPRRRTRRMRKADCASPSTICLWLEWTPFMGDPSVTWADLRLYLVSCSSASHKRDNILPDLFRQVKTWISTNALRLRREFTQCASVPVTKLRAISRTLKMHLTDSRLDLRGSSLASQNKTDIIWVEMTVILLQLCFTRQSPGLIWWPTRSDRI